MEDQSMVSTKLTQAQTARFLGTPVATLTKWRFRRKGPPYIKLEGKVVYGKDDLEAWIKSCRIVPAERAPRIRQAKSSIKRGSR